MSRTVTLAVTQMTCSPEPLENQDRGEYLVRDAASKGAKIILLQELFERPYFCKDQNPDYLQWAQPADGNPLLERFSALAKELEVILPLSFFESATNVFYNSVALLDVDGSCQGIYRKSHIPDGPGYQEKYYFTPGNTGFKVWDTRFGKLGVGICWDQWFPEAARLAALNGAQFLFYPTAIGFQECDLNESEQQISAWEIIQKSHAIANGLFVASVNRVQKEKDLTFWGNSFICNPFGKLIKQASGDKAEIIIASCKLDEIKVTRQSWPFLRDRRIDCYKNLNKIFLGSDE